MTRPRFSDFTDPLVIVGDEAWSSDELERMARRRKYEREYKRRRYHDDPEFRARAIANVQRYKVRHRDSFPTYKREWMRKARGNKPILVASLHDLACTGPTRATGCRCSKIKLYARKRAVA